MNERNSRHRPHAAPSRLRLGPARLIGAVAFVVLAVAAGTLIARAQPDAASTGNTVASSPETSGSPALKTGVAPSILTTTASRLPSATVSPHRGNSSTPVAASSSSMASSPSSSLVAPAGWRTLTMVNQLNQTIWPAIAADPKHPISATGWVLKPGASLSILIPDHWDVRMWARIGCSFNSAGVGSCLSGGCGKFQCGSTWGEFPSTLAEFNLNAWNSMDFYDVSLVEGNNLPMWVNSYSSTSTDKINANGCSAAGCTRNANLTCPAELRRVRDGQVVACLSTCLALNTAQTCCTGSYAPRSACTPSTWPINSAAVFKQAEPFAYSYVDDDATSVLTCTGECNYRVTWGVSS